MADNSKTFQELLIEQRTTNEKLSALNSDNKTIGQLLRDIRNLSKTPQSAEENITQALPEILNDNRLQKEKIDKEQNLKYQELTTKYIREFEEKEGLFKIDNLIEKQTKEITDLQEYNIMGFDDITKAIRDTLSYTEKKDTQERKDELSGEDSVNELVEELKKDKEDDNKNDKEGKTILSALFGGLAGSLAGLSLASIISGLGKSLLKGGLYGLIGAVIGDELIHQLDIESPELKSSIMKTIPSTALGYGIAGLPGALIGLAGSGLFGIYEYISGQNDEISTYDWATSLIGTAGFAAYLGRGKIKEFFKGKGSRFGSFTTLASLFKPGPLLIAAGIAAALGGAYLFITSRMEKYEKETMDRAKQLLDEGNIGETIASEKNIISPRGMNQYAGSQATKDLKDASKNLIKDYEKDKQFELGNAQLGLDAINQILDIPKEQLDEILANKGKTRDILETINNLTFLASREENLFGIDTQNILERLLTFQDLITKDLPYKDDIIGMAGEDYLKSIELQDEITNMEETLKQMLSEQGLTTLPNNIRGPRKDQYQSLFDYKKLIDEKKSELGFLNADLNKLKIGPEGQEVSMYDIANVLGQDKLLKMIEETNVMLPEENNLNVSLNKTTEAVDNLNTTLSDEKNKQVSFSSIVGGNRSSINNYKTAAVVSSGFTPQDVTFQSLQNNIP